MSGEMASITGWNRFFWRTARRPLTFQQRRVSGFLVFMEGIMEKLLRGVEERNLDGEGMVFHYGNLI